MCLSTLVRKAGVGVEERIRLKEGLWVIEWMIKSARFFVPAKASFLGPVDADRGASFSLFPLLGGEGDLGLLGQMVKLHIDVIPQASCLHGHTAHPTRTQHIRRRPETLQ